jgi:hypothetical protein
MKTPREILFERHQAAEPKLDAIRRTAVATLGDPGSAKAGDSSAVTDGGGSWREFLLSLRWHLAGMSAVWLVIVLLNLNVGHSVSLASAVPAGKIPSAQIILASLRENRRELLETIQSSESREARPPKLFPVQPRSERFPETLSA